MCTVRIRVLFFGVIRDVVGLREDSLDIPDGGSLGSVFEHYAGALSAAARDGGEYRAGAESAVFFARGAAGGRR